MIFNTFGSKANKAVILLHGGGLSPRSIMPQIDDLSKTYYVIAPAVDGHGEDFDTEFTSISDCADKLIDYINDELGGKIHAIWGLSIGAQITVDILSKQKDITKYAIIESALVYPMNTAAKQANFIYNMTYGLISKKWFSKMQARSLYLPKDMFEDYYNDTKRMSKKTLINMTISNASYPMPDGIKHSNAHTLVIVGGKELPIMKKSAYLINNTIKDSGLAVMQNSGHGEICLKSPATHVEIIKSFIQGDY